MALTAFHAYGNGNGSGNGGGFGDVASIIFRDIFALIYEELNGKQPMH